MTLINQLIDDSKLTKVWSNEDLDVIREIWRDELCSFGPRVYPSYAAYAGRGGPDCISRILVETLYCESDDLPLLINDVRDCISAIAPWVYQWRMEHGV